MTRKSGAEPRANDAPRAAAGGRRRPPASFAESTTPSAPRRVATPPTASPVDQRGRPFFFSRPTINPPRENARQKEVEPLRRQARYPLAPEQKGVPLPVQQVPAPLLQVPVLLLHAQEDLRQGHPLRQEVEDVPRQEVDARR